MRTLISATRSFAYCCGVAPCTWSMCFVTMPVSAEALASEELPFAAAYVLAEGPVIAVTRLGGAASAAALFDQPR